MVTCRERIYQRLMAMRAVVGPILTFVAVLTWQSSLPAVERGPISEVTRVSVGAWSDASELRKVDALIEDMIIAGDLVLEASHADTQLPGRKHEGFVQTVRSIPVYGAHIVRQTERGETVSIFGSIHTGIEVDANPVLSVSDLVALQDEGVSLAPRQPSQPLRIVRRLDGSYSLAYLVTGDDAVSYFVDAHDGHVVMKVDEKYRQSAVGFGLGVHGDSKKVSATKSSTRYEARDQLRPSDIVTFGPLKSDEDLNRLAGGTVLPGDIATNRDNNWTRRGIVDTHVHMGWTYDYLFKRHSWSGLSGRNSKLYGVRSSSAFARNNAFFVPPPFGPDGQGLAIFGTTSQGTPITTLDIVAHELMHGVTEFGVRRRNGDGLVSTYEETLGPSVIRVDGDPIQCENLVLRSSDGIGRSFVCSGGRFVLVSNHGGAIGEAVSDVFGTATEHFFHPTGDGPLTADYYLGEDVPELGRLSGNRLGPTRSLDDPASLRIDPAGAIGYPDHFSRLLRFALVRMGGGYLAIAPVVLVDDELFLVRSADGGGVHWNSTLLSHVFYLAVEGGRNRTSGKDVRGVGYMNRGQIERVFFRAVTELMPGALLFPDMANVMKQAVMDLFGRSSPAGNAVFDALDAVGL